MMSSGEACLSSPFCCWIFDCFVDLLLKFDELEFDLKMSSESPLVSACGSCLPFCSTILTSVSSVSINQNHAINELSLKRRGTKRNVVILLEEKVYNSDQRVVPEKIQVSGPVLGKLTGAGTWTWYLVFSAICFIILSQNLKIDSQ